ncbi:hypothetical protein [Prosthecobacter fluviatilis]|uniref:Nucleotidyltransferase n=1 Tax=Prosthecobacter fluviatilis TaxID=445931 RepID=A0ABW0KTF0_9BACT
MTADEIATALKLVREETDLNSKSLLLAGLVSELFRERGFEPVVVGGSAIEFYTDGAYMSGDTDICWTGWPQPSIDERGEIMRQIPGIQCRGANKSWTVEGLWVDLLGEIDYRSEKEFSRFYTPHGEVRLIPVEDALVERIYSARKWVGRYDEKDDDCAKKIMAAVVSGRLPIDWNEAYRVAASSKFDCVPEFNAVKTEVEAELAKSKS